MVCATAAFLACSGTRHNASRTLTRSALALAMDVRRQGRQMRGSRCPPGRDSRTRSRSARCWNCTTKSSGSCLWTSASSVVMPNRSRRKVVTIAGERASLDPPTIATSALPSASSSACTNERGTTTKAERRRGGLQPPQRRQGRCQDAVAVAVGTPAVEGASVGHNNEGPTWSGPSRWSGPRLCRPSWPGGGTD